MATELELKFSLDVDAIPTEPTLIDAFAGTEFRVEAKGIVSHADRYYDDPRLSLARAGVALRRRIGGGKIVATYKTRGQVVGSMHLRDEIELPMEGREWPDPIRDRVARFADVAALKGRFELETERHRFLVSEHEAVVAEVSVDHVEASRPTGGRTVQFAEVEIEDRGGGSATLQRIAERLGSIASLTPSDATKLERAQRMLVSDGMP